MFNTGRMSLATILLALLAACGGGGGGSDSGGTPPPPQAAVAITKTVVKPNPTGLKFGFWEVYSFQEATLSHMGKRPVSRAGFDAWIKFETAPGVYSFPDFNGYATTHLHGEQILAAVNISFSSKIAPKEPQTIPAFYNNDITDPATRAAAKRFLYAYVQALLNQAGAVVLTIDYEIIGGWRLSVADADRDTRARTWAAWYVEAAAVARQAAADLGKSGLLKLQPIVNTDPFEPGNPMASGAAGNRWLVDVVAASDSLALDTYHSDPALPVSDPTRTLQTIQFWIDQFSAGKPVMVTENGFTTITQQDASITRAQHQMKYTGTEAEQSQYYAALFPRLLEANRPGGLFHNQLRAFCIWSIVDNNNAADKDPADIYFGLLRLDGSAKPSAAVVASAIAGAEADSFHRPYAPSGAALDVSTAMAGGVDLQFNDGDDFEYLTYVDPQLAVSGHYTLAGTASQAGSLVLSVNGQWQSATITAGAFSLPIDAALLKPGQRNTLEIYAPGARFPFSQRLSGVKLLAG